MPFVDTSGLNALSANPLIRPPTSLRLAGRLFQWQMDYPIPYFGIVATLANNENVLNNSSKIGRLSDLYQPWHGIEPCDSFERERTHR